MISRRCVGALVLAILTPLLSAAGEEANWRVAKARNGETTVSRETREGAFRTVEEFLSKEPPGLLAVDAPPRPADAATASLILRINGDRIAAGDLTLTDDRLTTQAEISSAPRDFSIPIGQVRGILLGAGARPDDRAQLLHVLERHTLSDDTIFMENADRLAGELLAIQSNQATLRTSSGELTVALSRARGLALNRELWDAPQPVRLAAAVVTHNGSILSSGSCEANSEVVLLRWSSGESLAVPMLAVRRLSLYGPDTTPLSDLQPLTWNYTPFLPRRTARKPLLPDVHRTNRAFRGSLLTVNGRVFPRGIGVLSGTTLTYAVPAGAARFRTEVGIDDSAGSEGAALFRILVDDRAVWTSDIVSHGTEPQVAEVDVRGAKQLTLAVDYGPHADINDLADWCEPLFFGPPPADVN